MDDSDLKPHVEIREGSQNEPGVASVNQKTAAAHCVEGKLANVVLESGKTDRTQSMWINLMSQDHVKISKFLSLVLRHQPETVGMQFEPGGWLAIDQLIENAKRIGRQLDFDLLMEVVANNDKKRFAISEDGMKIRASQGHSVSSVELGMTPTKPPEQLYHGTVDRFLNSIRQTGLSKESRNHVHLSEELTTAEKVGQRRGLPIILKVDSGRMYRDGLPFFLSANNVWLTDSVPVQYLSFP